MQLFVGTIFEAADIPLCSGHQVCSPPRLLPLLRLCRRAAEAFYVRAERASLPPHAPDMLAVRSQAIDGARTCTSLDSQHCRLLPSRVVPTATGSPAGQLRLLHPSRTCIVTFARIGYAFRPTTGNWRSEDFHLARFTALSTAPLTFGVQSKPAPSSIPVLGAG